MNKRKLFTRGILFGYGAIAAQMIYSFASIPLALAYLSKSEFGMWSLINTIAAYMMIAEMGMMNSVMRHLLECTGTGDREKYGRIFTASALTLAAISLIVLFAGVIAALYCGRFFPIPEHLQDTFFNVMLCKAVLAAAGLAFGIVGVPLYVHHRQDLGQITQIGLFVIYFAVLYFGFRAGWGIYSLVANQFAGLLWTVGINSLISMRLGFFPKRGTWKLSTREEFLSVWHHAKSVFVIQMGDLLLNSTPQLLIARYLGLELSAAWTVYTRPFAILKQIVNRPFDVALPMIYEAYDKKNMKLVTDRWVEISQVILASSGVVFTVAAANNTAFVDIWTNGRIHWVDSVQWFIALYFYLVLAAGLAYGSVGMNKKIGASRYIPLIQGVTATALAIPATIYFSISGLLLVISLAYIPGMMAAGVRYLGQLTGHPPGALGWKGILRPSLVIPLVAMAAWIPTNLIGWIPGYGGLLLSSLLGTVLAASAMFSIGLSRDVRTTIISAARAYLHRMMPSAGGVA